MKEISYTNSAGNLVFTSHYHRTRGSCCESLCLHCPFGTTIKSEGFQFKKTSEKNDLLLIYLKNVCCGVAQLSSDNKITNISLKDNFRDQGITEEILNTYI